MPSWCLWLKLAITDLFLGLFVGIGIISVLFSIGVYLASIVSGKFIKVSKSPFAGTDDEKFFDCIEDDGKQSNTSSYHFETCEWFNKVLMILFFDFNNSEFAKRSQTYLTEHIKTFFKNFEPDGIKFITDVELLNFSFTNPLKIKNIQFFKGEGGSLESEAFEICFDLSLAGDVLIELSANILGFGRVYLEAYISEISTNLITRFVPNPTPRMHFMFTDLLNLKVNIQKTSMQSLPKFSNILTLAVKSLLRKRVVFPNYQTILFHRYSSTLKTTIYMPFWRSCRKFLKIKIKRLIIKEDLDLFEGKFHFILQLLAGQRFKSEAFDINSNEIHVNWIKQIDLHDDADLSLSLRLRLKGKKRLAKKMILLDQNISFSSLDPCVLQNFQYFFTGASNGESFVEIETYLSTDPFCVSESESWHFLRNIPEMVPEEEEYLDGINWANIRKAWQQAKKSNSKSENNDYHLYKRQLETLIQILEKEASSSEQNTKLLNYLRALITELEWQIIGKEESFYESETLSSAVTTIDLHRIVSHHYPIIMRSYSALRNSTGSVSNLPTETLEGEFRSFSQSMENLGMKIRNNNSIRSFTNNSDSKDGTLDIRTMELGMMMPFELVQNWERDTVFFNINGISVHWGEKVITINSEVARSQNVNNSFLATVERIGECQLKVCDEYVIVYKGQCGHKPIVIGSFLCIKWDGIKFTFDLVGTSINVKLTELDGERLLKLICLYNTSTLIKVNLTDITKFSIIHMKDIGFCSINNRIAFPLPLSKISLAINSFNSLQLGEVERSFIIKFPFNSNVIMNPDLRVNFGVCISQDNLEFSSRCYLRSSIPLPGRLYLCSIGIFFKSKLMDKKIVIHPKMIQSVTKYEFWNIRGITVKTIDGFLFEFLGLEVDEIEKFLTCSNQFK